jgi:putative tricarboxylic transport membrane protein
MTRHPRRARLLALAVGVLLLAASGCGVTRGAESADMTMLIPNSTGGSFEVTNVIGAGGSVAMTRLMNAEGDGRTLMTAGLGVVGSLYSFAGEHKMHDATPLAQLISDQEGVLVPGDSPYRTIDDLVAAWRKDPDGIVIGGGSSPGGPDHLFPMQLAGAVGMDPREVRYVVYDGGGPLTSALLGKKIDVGFSGVGEFEGQIESGELRLLAVSGEERLDGDVVDEAPTLKESGIDLVFTNWRGVFAPPGISEQRRDELISMLEEMRQTPEWQQALEDNGWIDDFKTGEEFTAFLQDQDQRVATTLEELELL